MKLFTKEINVKYDEVKSSYTVSLSTSADGTVFTKVVFSLEEVFKVLSNITKTKITWGE